MKSLKNEVLLATVPPLVPKHPTIPAKDVPTYGGFFRKPGGEYVHMRISEASVRFLKLDESKVYGVTFTGNVSVLDPDKPVVLCTVDGLVANVAANQAFEALFGRR